MGKDYAVNLGFTPPPVPYMTSSAPPQNLFPTDSKEQACKYAAKWNQGVFETAAKGGYNINPNFLGTAVDTKTGKPLDCKM